MKDNYKFNNNVITVYTPGLYDIKVGFYSNYMKNIHY